MKNFNRQALEKQKKLKISAFILMGAFCLFFLFELYVPKSPAQSLVVIYEAKEGSGINQIANELANQKIIKNAFFFKFYIIISGWRSNLQAGKYDLSSSMSVAKITEKFVSGDVIKNKITIIEGWNLEDIARYLESKDFYAKKDFLDSSKKDWSQDFEFLKDLPPARASGAQAGKPKYMSLEGYIFPDTYYLPIGAKPDKFLKTVLNNFNKKLNPDLKSEILRQHKSIFQIITMASILEKEVKSSDDKKIVSGILWKRIKNNIPLQIDSTINYITGKNDPRVSIKDTKINSPYNTYKYYGLPEGPISNPGMDSILAAVYPKNSPYWYYLSADETGKTIFSETLREHEMAIARYLKP